MKPGILYPVLDSKPCSRTKYEEVRVQQKQRTRWKDVVKTVAGPHGLLQTSQVDTGDVLLSIA
jgi:hypothetical protein